MWKSSYSDHYGVIPEANSWELDLSHKLYGKSRVSLEMIVGEPDQLSVSNMRYYLDISITDPGTWLTASVKRQKEDGSTEDLEISNEYYSDNGDWKFEGLDKRIRYQKIIGLMFISIIIRGLRISFFRFL